MWGWVAGAAMTAMVHAAEVPEVSGTVQLLHPSVDAQQTLWTDDASRRRHRALGLRTQASWTSRPLVYDVGGEVQTVESSVWQLDVLGAVTLGPLRLGVDVPLQNAAPSDVYRRGTTGLGDLALDGKLTVLDPTLHPLGLAFASRWSFPTGTVDRPLARTSIEGEATAIVDYEVGEVVRLLANAGARFGAPLTLGEEVVGAQLLVRLGAAVPVTDRAGVSAEFAGRLPLGGPFGLGAPAEVILGGWVDLGEAWSVRGGLGRGFSSAAGAPSARALVAVAFEPAPPARTPRAPAARTRPPRAADRDHDGIDDAADDCPDQPEDADGYLDGDGCPDEVALIVRVQDARGAIVHSAFAWIQCPDRDARLAADAAVELPAGTCTLEVAAPGWSSASDTIVVEEGPPVERIVQLQPTSPVGYVTATVTDESGTALHAAWAVGTNGSELPLRQGRGRLVMAPGTYDVRITRPGFEPERTTVQVGAGDEISLDVVLREQ